MLILHLKIDLYIKWPRKQMQTSQKNLKPSSFKQIKILTSNSKKYYCKSIDLISLISGAIQTNT